MQEKNNVTVIEFRTADGQKHGISNPEAVKLLVNVAVIELERQHHQALLDDIPEHLEQSREYKAAKQLEYAMNDFGFKPERFAEALPFFHGMGGNGIHQLHVLRRVTDNIHERRD